jgi:hypothetical protein
MATITFSNTVKSGNNRTFWKVRAIPNRQATATLDTGVPRKRTAPLKAGKAPATRLNRIHEQEEGAFEARRDASWASDGTNPRGQFIRI